MQHKFLDGFLDNLVIVGFSIVMVIAGVNAFTSFKGSHSADDSARYSVTVGEIQSLENSSANLTAAR